MSTHDAPNPNDFEELERLTEVELQKASQMDPKEIEPDFSSDVPQAQPVQAIQSQQGKRTYKRKNVPEPVTHTLSTPIEVWEGDTLVSEISSLTLTRPRGKDVARAVETDTPMLAVVCGIDADLLQEIDGDDFAELMEKAGPFFPKRLMDRIQAENGA